MAQFSLASSGQQWPMDLGHWHWHWPYMPQVPALQSIVIKSTSGIGTGLPPPRTAEVLMTSMHNLH
eukprot:11971117-Karenia_brevis.AAC.1